MSLLCLERLKDLPFHSVKTGILTVAAGLAFEIGSPISFLTFPLSFPRHCSATRPVSHLFLLQPCPQACLPTSSALLPHVPRPSVLWGSGQFLPRVVVEIR